MRDVVCECGARFDSPRDAVEHGKKMVHRISGLYYAHRKELEEFFHQCGFCTHEKRWLGGGATTRCIASNAISSWEST
jgi:hypothetical protein